MQIRFIPLPLYRGLRTAELITELQRPPCPPKPLTIRFGGIHAMVAPNKIRPATPHRLQGKKCSRLSLSKYRIMSHDVYTHGEISNISLEGTSSPCHHQRKVMIVTVLFWYEESTHFSWLDKTEVNAEVTMIQGNHRNIQENSDEYRKTNQQLGSLTWRHLSPDSSTWWGKKPIMACSRKRYSASLFRPRNPETWSACQWNQAGDQSQSPQPTLRFKKKKKNIYRWWNNPSSPTPCMLGPSII